MTFSDWSLFSPVQVDAFALLSYSNNLHMKCLVFFVFFFQNRIILFESKVVLIRYPDSMSEEATITISLKFDLTINCGWKYTMLFLGTTVFQVCEI